MLTSFGDERSKACGGMPLKKHSKKLQKEFSGPFWSVKKEHRQRLAAVHPICRQHLSCLLLSVMKEVRPTVAHRKKHSKKLQKDFSLPFCLPKRKKKPAGSRQNRTANPGTPRFRSLPAECRKYPPHASGGSPGHNTPATSAGLSDTAPGQTRNSRCQTARTCRSPGPSSCTG